MEEITEIRVWVGTNVYARTITMTTALIRLAKVAILIA
jgi:hypothetical protein